MASTGTPLEAIARRWIEEGWQRGRLAIVDELHAPQFVDHDPGGRVPDNIGFRAGIAALYDAFPDFHATIEDLVVEPSTGKVAVRWTATGTHSGAYLGTPPTGRTIAFRGIEIIRIENELIVERWGEWDGMGLLDQLGRLG